MLTGPRHFQNVSALSCRVAPVAPQAARDIRDTPLKGCRGVVSRWATRPNVIREVHERLNGSLLAEGQTRRAASAIFGYLRMILIWQNEWSRTSGKEQ